MYLVGALASYIGVRRHQTEQALQYTYSAVGTLCQRIFAHECFYLSCTRVISTKGAGIFLVFRSEAIHRSSR